MLIIDTDAASVLAKGELIEQTLELFQNHEIVITPKIEEELEKPLEHGYDYPNKIFQKINTENPTEKERKLYREQFNEQTVDKGELEAITVSKNRDSIFFTMDQKAAKYAEKKGVQTLSFNNLAQLLIDKQIITQDKLEKRLHTIEQRDNRELDIENILNKD